MQVLANNETVAKYNDTSMLLICRLSKLLIIRLKVIDNRMPRFLIMSYFIGEFVASSPKSLEYFINNCEINGGVAVGLYQ